MINHNDQVAFDLYKCDHGNVKSLQKQAISYPHPSNLGLQSPIRTYSKYQGIHHQCIHDTLLRRDVLMHQLQ